MASFKTGLWQLLAESRSTDDAISRQLSLFYTAQINSKSALQRLPHKR